MVFTHDMRGGETAAGGVRIGTARAELLTQPSPSTVNSVMSDVWGGSYRMINRANLALSKAPGVTDNTSLRDRLVGEAKFLRAWAYFELVSQWGEVPMYTEPVISTTGFKGKEPINNIYTLIVTDLTDAIAKLPTSYSGSDLGRATKYSAYALLGKGANAKRRLLLPPKQPCCRFMVSLPSWLTFYGISTGTSMMLVLQLQVMSIIQSLF
jgi:hypothetical protein